MGFTFDQFTGCILGLATGDALGADGSTWICGSYWKSKAIGDADSRIFTVDSPAKFQVVRS